MQLAFHLRNAQSPVCFGVDIASSAVFAMLAFINSERKSLAIPIHIFTMVDDSCVLSRAYRGGVVTFE